MDTNPNTLTPETIIVTVTETPFVCGSWSQTADLRDLHWCDEGE
ncbi:MAG: hypothetical protein WC538_22240 [Thermoanaerobaculia bacterium]|jgi:hypothetical protein